MDSEEFNGILNLQTQGYCQAYPWPQDHMAWYLHPLFPSSLTSQSPQGSRFLVPTSQTSHLSTLQACRYTAHPCSIFQNIDWFSSPFYAHYLGKQWLPRLLDFITVEVPLLSVCPWECWGVSSALVVIMEAITCSRHLWDDSRVHI